jgi:hypothetical protein
LLEDAETKLLYDRLVLERNQPESKLLIPKLRQKKKFARHPSSAIEAIMSVSATADGQVLRSQLNQADNVSKHSSRDGDS